MERTVIKSQLGLNELGMNKGTHTQPFNNFYSTKDLKHFDFNVQYYFHHQECRNAHWLQLHFVKWHTIKERERERGKRERERGGGEEEEEEEEEEMEKLRYWSLFIGRELFQVSDPKHNVFLNAGNKNVY